MHSAEQAREWLTLLRETLRQLGVSRREHGGGLAALRRQRLHPPGGLRPSSGTKTELKNMNSFRFLDAGHPRRDRAPDRAAGGRRAGRAGDAALRPAPAARSPRCAPRRRRTTTATSPSPTSCRCVPTEEMLAGGARRRCPSCRRRGPSATSATGRCRADDRAAAGLPARAAATTSRRPRRRRAEGASAVVANWVGELVGRIGADADPAASASRRGAGHAGRAGRGQGTVTARRRAPGARPARRRGRRPRGDRRARGPRRDGRRRRARRRSSPRCSRRNPDAAERVRGGNEKAIGALVGPVMRETKGRADGGEVKRLIREQLGL